MGYYCSYVRGEEREGSERVQKKGGLGGEKRGSGRGGEREREKEREREIGGWEEAY